MATFSQLPGVLNLAIVQGDEVNIAINFAGIDLTGYLFSSVVYVTKQTVPLGGGISVPAAGQTAATVVVTPVSLATGALMVGLSETQTAALSPLGSYRWYLRWVTPGAITRTVLGGVVSVASP